ncbi:MAG: hypothetical protein ACD_79C00638G0003 [uncultured bacterium]|nr:MAG: hypothetical protein ACD_79C00638G0003 [uncultured bacterium]
MGFIQELTDLISKLNFVTIVHEYEQGLYFRNGIAIEQPIRRFRSDDLDEIVTTENELQQKFGYFRHIFDKKGAKLPPGFKRTWYGKVIHQKRFSKILKAGVYFHIPLIEHIVTDYKQERILDLGYVSVLTNDPEPESKAVIISCNLRYELMDFYRAYTAVYDYVVSLRYHTQSILAEKSIGKKYEEWKNPDTIANLERQVIEELRKVVTDKWGLKIHQLYVTDVTDTRIIKIVGDSHTSAPPSNVLLAASENQPTILG